MILRGTTIILTKDRPTMPTTPAGHARIYVRIRLAEDGSTAEVVYLDRPARKGEAT